MYEQLPLIISAVGTIVAVIISFVLGIKKDKIEVRNADDAAGDKLRDDLIALFEAQNKRLNEQDARLARQQEVIDKLQALVDSLRETNHVLLTEKHTLSEQNGALAEKLKQWEAMRKTIVVSADAQSALTGAGPDAQPATT